MKINKCIFYILCLAFLTKSIAAQQSSSIADPSHELMADNILLWQRTNGGWPKDTYDIFFDDSKTSIDNDTNKEKKSPVKVLINYRIEQTVAQRKLALDSKYFTDATIDNGHTVSEIRYLLSAAKRIGNSSYTAAAGKGVAYLLKAQYNNGGWPQFYPDSKTYRPNITFNDNAMMNVMNLMLDISTGLNNTDVLQSRFAADARKAFDKGIGIILKTQLVLNGKKTAWCAQYNEITLKPSKARAYELPSLSGSESVEIVRVLMKIEQPAAEVKQAIVDAVAWFESSKISGYSTRRIRDTLQPKGQDVVVVPADGAVMWARFYDLDTQQPFFCDRDGIKKNTLAEIGNERRAGYAWYGTWPLKLLTDEFPAWKKKHVQ